MLAVKLSSRDPETRLSVMVSSVVQPRFTVKGTSSLRLRIPGQAAHRANRVPQKLKHFTNPEITESLRERTNVSQNWNAKKIFVAAPKRIELLLAGNL
jgi:hypothetical protein